MYIASYIIYGIKFAPVYLDEWTDQTVWDYWWMGETSKATTIAIKKIEYNSMLFLMEYSEMSYSVTVLSFCVLIAGLFSFYMSQNADTAFFYSNR